MATKTKSNISVSNTTMNTRKVKKPIPKRPWTKEEDKKIWHLKYVEKLTYKEIAEIVEDRTLNAIMKRLHQIRHGSNGYVENAWTKKEIDILYKYIGILDFESIAKKVKRSVLAVERKAAHLGISNISEMSGLITVHHLSKILQIDDKTIYRWIESHNFPVKRLKLSNPNSRGNNYVSIPEFWSWAEKHKERINWFKVERLVLIPEPHWVDECRKIDYYKKPLIRPWTKAEERKVWTMFYSENRTQKEIAELTGRSVRSIQRKLQHLRENEFTSIS